MALLPLPCGRTQQVFRLTLSFAPPSLPHRPPGRVQVNTYSKSKYASVINEAGGWAWLQELLAALAAVGQVGGALQPGGTASAVLPALGGAALQPTGTAPASLPAP